MMSNRESHVTYRSLKGLPIFEDEDEPKIDPKVEREKEIVSQRTGLGEMNSKLLDDFGFAINRLHDPCNYDHTTIQDMLSTYHFRDLANSKLFRIAQKIFGDKMDSKFRMRTRTFNLHGVAQGIPVITGAKPINDKSQAGNFEIPPAENPSDDEDLVDVNDLRLHQKSTVKQDQTETTKIQEDNDLRNSSKYDAYKEWFDRKRELRHQLNSMGLSESWLMNKPDRTAVEESLYQQMMAEKRMYSYLQTLDEEFLLEEEDLSKSMSNEEPLPRIRRPSPIALRKIDRFLRKNRMRLIDIFTTIDKDKTWTITRDRFKSAVQQYDIDISPSLLEDLMTTLDVEQNGLLYYKDLAKGMDLYKLEKRDAKKKGVPMPQDDYQDPEDEDPSTMASEGNSRITSGKVNRSLSKSASSKQSKGSRVSSATTLLETPELDIQESRYVLECQEQQVDLRKRDKNFLKYLKSEQRFDTNKGGYISPHLVSQGQSKTAAFKTGYKPIDEHCKRSMLNGDTGEMVNQFRQLKLKEYYSIMNLCDERGVTLSRHLLDHVLLHPGDKTTRLMLKQGIRQPGASVPLSMHFADPPKKPRTPIEIRNKGKIKRGIDGQLMIDYKHRFLTQAKATPKPKKVQLPTGKATITRKVDCWLTFEEYENMTRDFYKKRYVKMESTDPAEGTWPGYMLDRMRLYLDKEDGSSADALFDRVRRKPLHYHGYDNDLNNWQVSDNGYLTQGSLRHPKTNYTSNNLEPKHRPDIIYKNHLVHKPTLGLTMHTKNTQFVNHS